MTSINMHPNDMQLRRHVRERLDAGDWDAAQAALEELTRQSPGDIPLRMELAELLLRRGRMRAATAQLVECVPLLPNDAPLIARLAWQLSSAGETRAARRCIEHLERAPHPPGWVLAEQAQLRWMLGDIPAAEQRIDRAVKAGIDTPGEHYLQAMLLQFTGRLQEAEAVLTDILARWPAFGDAAVILVNLRRQTNEHNHLQLLRDRLERLPDAADDTQALLAKAKFESAIFKVLDDLGRHDEAWPALARSNALMHSLLPYDANAEVALADALVQASEAIDGRPVDAFAHAGPTPIFIVGMPRSGSTLLDHMLSAHSDVTSAGEIGDFQRQLHWVADIAPRGHHSLQEILRRPGQIDFQQLGARYLEQTQWRGQGHRFYIDKLPANIRMVPFIRRALPHAPILHVVRDPMDVCYSNLKVMFGNASPYCYEIGALAHYHGQYVRLARHWREALPGAVLDVSYSDLVSAPESTLQQVMSHCGLAMEAACLYPERNAAPVATPSSAQIRQPLHTRSLGEWKRYADKLGPLQHALAAYPAV